VSLDQAGSVVILDTMTSCSGFSFSLGIFMFFLMFLFRSWVHGVFYRFHALNIPTSFFHHGSGWTTKDTLRLLFEEGFF
jgi:hypothetical protein